MTATLATSACVAWCIFTPGGHPITLLKLSDLLSISFKARRPGASLAGWWPSYGRYPPCTPLNTWRTRGGENHFFGFYLLSYAVTLGIAFAEDLMTLYIFYELLTPGNAVPGHARHEAAGRLCGPQVCILLAGRRGHGAFLALATR